jgi:hypothetical protein
LAALGDRFQARTVLKACERHLATTAVELGLATRLLIAERFALKGVRVRVNFLILNLFNFTLMCIHFFQS